jgi:predicted ABC-type ATPase
LLNQHAEFAIETTLATKSYQNLISEAGTLNYKVVLLFFWLPSTEFAKERVLKRVTEGGHSIPPDVIERRYKAGLSNLRLFLPIVDRWYVYDNESTTAELVAKGGLNKEPEIVNFGIWGLIKT